MHTTTLNPHWSRHLTELNRSVFNHMRAAYPIECMEDLRRLEHRVGFTLCDLQLNMAALGEVSDVAA